MGIITRLLRLCKSDVHGVMDQLEDKGLLLKQHLREMESSLRHKEQEIGVLTQRIDDVALKIKRHGGEMDKLERDLTLALEKGRDDIARMLIRRRHALEATSGHLGDQMETMKREIQQNSETLAHQKLQNETLKARADAYYRRADDRRFATSAAPHVPGASLGPQPSDEEVELELLHRKEALHEGGTS